MIDIMFKVLSRILNKINEAKEIKKAEEVRKAKLKAKLDDLFNKNQKLLQFEKTAGERTLKKIYCQSLFYEIFKLCYEKKIVKFYYDDKLLERFELFFNIIDHVDSLDVKYLEDLLYKLKNVSEEFNW